MLSPGTLLQNRYFIVEPIGKGGMGAVYLAVDQRLGNNVALKATLHSSDGRLRAAFEREARLLASLHHPALPGVMDYFVESNGQFLVMEYIPGDDMSEMLQRQGGAFPPGEVLGWADQLLDALDYLHTREPTVVHRDIKPSNLKLTARGQVILLDFGLAKDTVAQSMALQTSKTVFGYSLNYAPLEQLQGQGTGPRSDLYSFGATLYHLLTGVPPVDVLTRLDSVASGRSDPLRRANELNSEVPPAAAAILHQSMAVSREQRPATAAEIRTVLRNANTVLRQSLLETLSAYRPSDSEPRASASPAPPAAKITSGSSSPETTELPPGVLAPTTRQQIIRAPLPSAPPPSATEDAQKQRTAESFATAPSQPSEQPDPPDSTDEKFQLRVLWVALAAGSASLVLAATVVSFWLVFIRGGDDPENDTSSPPITRVMTPTPAPPRPSTPTGTELNVLPTARGVNEVAASADGRTIAAVVEGNEVLLWQLNEDNAPRKLQGHTRPGVSVAVSPDGRTVASGSDDGTVRLWQAADGSLIRTLAEHSDYAFIVGFSPDGRKLVSAGGDKTISVIDLAENRILHRMPLMPDDQIITISPDLQTVALLGSDKGVKLVSVSDGGTIATLEGHSYDVQCGAFSADRSYLALGSEGGTVRVWRVADGSFVHAQQGASGPVGSVAFSPGGKLLAAGWSDGRIGIWRVSDTTLTGSLEGHEKPVGSLSFSEDGTTLISGDSEKTVRIWRITEE
ncbi:MAG TPA: serine/threonine-protein kinase [Pyrinomonadaceae bacterium]|nr:serine/threonine-protein kinase [Pyrinomonadaceae bacterium]